MIIGIPTMLFAFIQIALLIVLLVLSVRMIRESDRSLTAVFLVFVYSLWMLTDLYWFIYDFMRPDRQKPFAVNEIGEAAIFLLMAALLSSAIGSRLFSTKKQALGAALFSVCNVALWIVWSGEWVQDILIGAVFTYFLCSVACALKSQRRLSGNEWIGLGIGCTLLIIAQVITFFVEPQIGAAVETGCYIFLTAGTFYWGYKLIAARREHAGPKAILCLVMAFMSWTLMAKYMSAGIWYSAFMIVETMGQLLMYLSVRKVVTEA